MKNHRLSGTVLTTAILVVLMFTVTASDAFALTVKQRLGKRIFFDMNLSNPPGQSCASCHDPLAGFAEPDSYLPVSEGIILGSFGARNAPSAAYASFSPKFRFDKVAGLYIGGQFWDGRAKDLAMQARKPFVNPVEMNATAAYVVNQVRNSAYSAMFLRVYGPTALDVQAQAFAFISDAIAAYERSVEVNKFSSKYDQVQAGLATFTALEARGENRFNGKGKCSKCHINTASPNGTPALFTDFTYDNLGIPSNPEVLTLTGNPNFIDLGLGASPALAAPDPLQDGKHKVPTLRNIAKTAPYGHNGYFKTLKEIVHFYNTRDVPGAGWPAPEVAANVNTAEMGDLGLTASDENAIVAFLLTLTDQ